MLKKVRSSLIALAFALCIPATADAVGPRAAVNAIQRRPARGRTAQRRVSSARTRARVLDIVGHGAVDVADLQPREREAHAAATDYVTARGYPIRTVRLGTADRPVTRMFVPILSEADQLEFERQFGPDAGGVTLRWVADETGHIALVLKPGSSYLWGKSHGGYREHNLGGYSFAVRLGAARVAHLTNFVANNTAPNAGSCIEWLPNAPVAENEMLFHVLGINRSRSGPNMRAKLIHAANDLVHVVGVHVGSLEAFNALQDSEMLRPPPSGGVEDAAR